MGKILILFALLAAQMPSGDRSQITVKRTDLNNGVVIVPALEGKTSLELQCNNGVPSCTALTRGITRWCGCRRTAECTTVPTSRSIPSLVTRKLPRRSAPIA
jgi:hypothetical protein